MKALLLAAGAALGLSLAAQADIIYFSDFETDGGGWVATATWDDRGDWEWTNTYDGTQYQGGSAAPLNAYSGTGLWGTVLYDDYTNSGGETFLSQTFDFTGYTGVEMNWMTWNNAFYSWDTTKVYVNGDMVWDYGYYNDAPTWEMASIDLSAYDGMGSVEIVFELHASTVVEKAGWYIDDVAITGVPAPGALAVLGLAGLVSRRRR